MKYSTGNIVTSACGCLFQIRKVTSYEQYDLIVVKGGPTCGKGIQGTVYLWDVDSIDRDEGIELFNEPLAEAIYGN